MHKERDEILSAGSPIHPWGFGGMFVFSFWRWRGRATLRICGMVVAEGDQMRKREEREEGKGGTPLFLWYGNFLFFLIRNNNILLNEKLINYLWVQVGSLNGKGTHLNLGRSWV